MDRFFSLFGKIVLGTIVLGIILGIGYYVGHTKIIQPTLKLTPTPQAMMQSKAQVSPSTVTITQPTTQVANKKTVTGGLESGTSFSPYSLQIPDGWSEKKDVTPGVIDKLTLSNGDYSLSIYQAAIGGGGCRYKGDPEQMMSQTFGNYVDITNNNEQYRRSWNDEGKDMQSYTICQKGTDTYGAPTQFGAISYTTPKNVDTKILSEMDEIVASLQKK
ncbi:MAG: hypothetical protein KBD46_03250 [Candidatus Levybacteria bacterium]|nr:hypothetical protein [Candidatus Levybacteria bacterium]